MSHIDPGDPPPAYKGPVDDFGPVNNDPINAWRPGPVSEQLSRPAKELINMAKPEREGPNYAKASDEDPVRDSLWFNMSYPADLVPERTMWILQNPGMEALRAFVRHQLEYHNVDEALGLQGQFAEIHHITQKLRRLLWNRRGAVVPDEDDARRELNNMIGHCLLALDHLNKGNNDGS